MDEKQNQLDLSYLEKKINLLEVDLQEKEKVLNRVSGKSEKWWNPINVVLAIILVSIPIVGATISTLFLRTHEQLNEVQSITKTTNLLIKTVAQFQRIELDYNNKFFELSELEASRLITSLEDELKEDIKSFELRENLKELLMVSYTWKAVSLYRIDNDKYINDLRKIGNRMIELDSSYWKGYQIRAYGRKWNSIDDFELVASDLKKAIERSDYYNSNGINLPEVYFINNQYGKAKEWAVNFETVQFKNDVTRYRSARGQAAFYLYRYLSEYILQDDPNNSYWIDTCRILIDKIPEKSHGRFEIEKLNRWFNELDINDSPLLVGKKDKIKMFYKEKILKENEQDVKYINQSIDSAQMKKDELPLKNLETRMSHLDKEINDLKESNNKNIFRLWLILILGISFYLLIKTLLVLSKSSA